MDHDLWKAVVDLMHDGLLLVAPDGSIEAVNPAFEELTGYSSREVIGKACTILKCTGCTLDPTGDRTHWCALFETARQRRLPCEITAKDGRVLQVIKDATVLRGENGELVRAVETLRDVTSEVQSREQVKDLRSTLYRQTGLFNIVGASIPVQRLLDMIEQVARSEAPVSIRGESGVGKELVARAIHEAGARAEGPFVRINCSCLNENLLESELFGHVKGAFSGADRSRVGRFEAASGGSIFLDEIGDISPAIQVKLLRVLEAREIERVGDHTPIPVDVRIITATNRNLEQLVAGGVFREDLYYRINVVPVYVPTLRERKEDVPLVAQSFVERIASRSGKSIKGFTDRAMSALLAHEWPGNVRELLNAVEYAFVLCPGGLIDKKHLPRSVQEGRAGALFRQVPDEGSTPSPPSRFGSRRSVDEREELLAALEQAGGHREEAGKILGVSRVTIWKRMKKHGLL